MRNSTLYDKNLLQHGHQRSKDISALLSHTNGNKHCMKCGIFVTKRIFLQLRGVYGIHVVDEIVHYQQR